MKLKKKLLSVLLAALMLVQLLPSVALAAKWTPASGEAATSDGFISSQHSDQFIIGKDSNSFMHYYDDFSTDNYPISENYLNQLLALGSYPNQCRIINKIRSSWSGSCYGIASTMVLNRLAEQGYGTKRLNIAAFQPGVTSYFSLGVPKTHPPVLDMINYYMLSQLLDTLYSHNVYVPLSKLGFVQAKLNTLVESVKTEIDSGRCYQMSYYSAHGGHSIVGTDYYEYTENSVYHIILKFYDENARRGGAGRDYDTFSYIEFVKDGNDYTSPYKNADNDPEFRFFAYDRDSQHPYEVLSGLMFIDAESFNEYISIHDPAAAPTSAAQEPILQFHDIERSYMNYSVKPFTGSLGTPSHVSNYGVFSVPNAMLPCLVNVNNADVYFPHMDHNKYRFIQSSPNDPALCQTDVELTLKTADGSSPFAGYDVCSSDGALSSYTMSKDTGVNTGNFAYITGTDINYSRFDVNGKLQKIVTYNKNGIDNDIGVLVGSKSSDGNYDMFLMKMKKASYIELYDKTDSRIQDNSIVLHSDGFPNGLAFQFFKGASQSVAIAGSTDAGDRWLKITSEVGTDGIVEVSVYSSVDSAAGATWPTFGNTPDWSTRITDPLSGTSSSSASGEGSRNQYRLAGSTNELSYNGGDFVFTVDGPFEKYISTSMDGVMIENKYVKVEKGSTVITVSSDFMSTLKEGTHVLRVQFTDGFMQSVLKVGNASAAQTAVPDVPATGAPLPFGFTLLAAALVCAVFAISRKRRAK